jgi:uncharacterized protein YozE (UPF0346 family)
MIEFANLPATERETYFQETAERSRLPAHLVEKDFWVCYVLRLLFSNAEIARYLTFKGGTSLSKVYKAIDRFSEDIDFAVSRESLGFAAAAAPDAPGISMEERRRRLTRLSASCLTWTTDSLFPAIRQALTNSLGTNRWSVDMVADENGNQHILFSYPRSALTLGNSYNPPRVRIELTARTDNHPSQPATVVPYVAENFPDAISDSSVNVEVLRIERTFWEKATSDIKKISNNLLTQQDVETAMTTFDPIWESMTLRDQIRLVQVVIKQVDYDGESGRVTITFNPIGIKRRAEHATKDLEEARA